jgi:NDP-sugar pyrophosphorylase family protein
MLQRTEASVILGAGPDVFSPGLEYAPLLDRLRLKQADVVVAMGPAPAAERAAVYTIAADGRVLSWERRPSSDGQELLNLSGYALTRAALERIERAGFSSFLEDEVQPFVISELRTFAYVVPGLSVNVNAPIDLVRARELAVSRAHGAGSEGPRSGA